MADRCKRGVIAEHIARFREGPPLHKDDRPVKQDFWWMGPAGTGAVLSIEAEPEQQETPLAKSNILPSSSSVLPGMNDRATAANTHQEGSASDMDALQHLIACNPNLLKALTHIERNEFGTISDRAMEHIREALDSNISNPCNQAEQGHPNMMASNTGSTSSAPDDASASSSAMSSRRASTHLSLSIDVSEHMDLQSSSEQEGDVSSNSSQDSPHTAEAFTAGQGVRGLASVGQLPQAHSSTKPADKPLDKLAVKSVEMAQRRQAGKGAALVTSQAAEVKLQPREGAVATNHGCKTRALTPGAGLGAPVSIFSSGGDGQPYSSVSRPKTAPTAPKLQLAHEPAHMVQFAGPACVEKKRKVLASAQGPRAAGGRLIDRVQKVSIRPLTPGAGLGGPVSIFSNSGSSQAAHVNALQDSSLRPGSVPAEQADSSRSAVAATGQSQQVACVGVRGGGKQQSQQQDSGRTCRKDRPTSAPGPGKAVCCEAGLEGPAGDDAHGLVRFKEPQAARTAAQQHAEGRGAYAVAGGVKQAAQRWRHAVKLIKRPPTPGRALGKPVSIFSASAQYQQHSCVTVEDNDGDDDDNDSDSDSDELQETPSESPVAEDDEVCHQVCSDKQSSPVSCLGHKSHNMTWRNKLSAKPPTPGVSLGKPVSIFRSSSEPAVDSAARYAALDRSQTGAADIQPVQAVCHGCLSSSGKQRKQCRVSFDGDAAVQDFKDECVVAASSSARVSTQQQQAKPRCLTVSPACEVDLMADHSSVETEEGAGHKEHGDSGAQSCAAECSAAANNSSMLHHALMQQNSDLALDKQQQIDKEQRKAVTTPGAGSLTHLNIFKETSQEGQQQSCRKRQGPKPALDVSVLPQPFTAEGIAINSCASRSKASRSSSFKETLLQLNPDLALEKQQQWEKQQAKVPTTPGAGPSFNLFRNKKEQQQQQQQPIPEKLEAAKADSPDNRGRASRSSSMKEALLQLNPSLALDKQQQWEQKQAKVPTTPGAISFKHFSLFKDSAESNQHHVAVQHSQLPEHSNAQSVAGVDVSKHANSKTTSRSSSLKEALLQLHPDLALEKQQQHDRQLAKVPTTPGGGVSKHFSVFKGDGGDEQQQQHKQVSAAQAGPGTAVDTGSTASSRGMAKRSSSMKEALLQLNPSLALEQQQQREQKQAKVPTTPGAGTGKPFNMFKDDVGNKKTERHSVAMSSGPGHCSTGALAVATCGTKSAAPGRAQSPDPTAAARQPVGSPQRADDRLGSQSNSQHRRSETSPLRSVTTAADAAHEAELLAAADRQSPLRHSTTSFDPDPARMSPLGHNRISTVTSDSTDNCVASDHSQQPASLSRLSGNPGLGAEMSTARNCSYTAGPVQSSSTTAGSQSAEGVVAGRYSPSRLSRRGTGEQELQTIRNPSPLSSNSSNNAIVLSE